jgi:hypothetical protein
MLTDIMPSVELTGGPWYDGNDLDEEFIKEISNACEALVIAKVRVCTCLLIVALPPLTIMD